MTIDKVKELIAEQLGIKVSSIKEDSNLVTDLGADSLDLVEMLMTLEEEFGVSIPDDKTKDMQTVKAIVTLIDENSKK